MWGYRRAMGKSWGINPKIAIWMYKTILLPQILYALVVWWPMVSKVEAKNVLRCLQGCYLRAAVGVKTTTEVLEIVLWLSLDSLIHCIQIQLSGKVEEYRVKTYET